MNKNIIENDDFSKTLLNLKENEDNTIKEVEETNDKETDIATFVVKNKWQVYRDIAKIFTERSKHDNELKKEYSKILVIILAIQLIALNLIFILRGTNVLVFADTTFNLFISATIAEVFALVTIIIKYLFTDNLTRLLSNILTEVKEDVIEEEKNNNIKR